MSEKYDLNAKEKEKRTYEKTLEMLLSQEKEYSHQLDMKEEISK